MLVYNSKCQSVLGHILVEGGRRVLGGGLDWLALGHLQGGLVHVEASHSLLLLGIGVSIPVGVGVGGLGGGLVWLALGHLGA